MRRALLAVLLSALASRASAFPSYVNYQGKLGDASGNPRSGVYSFRFKIFAQAAGGSALFSEDVTGANAVNVSNGLYSVQIGSYTAGGLPFSAVANAESWLEIDVNSGANLTGAETLAPRERLASSPFALRALLAESFGGGEIALSTINATATTPYGGVVVSTNLLIGGGLRFPGSATDGFLTPNGSVVPTKINVPLYDPGAFGQMFAMGVPASAQTTSRAMLALDARTVPHQATFLTLSPNESQGVGFSFDGDDNSAYLKSSVGMVFRMGGLITGSDVMSVKPNGMIGIGTTSQAARLHVSSANAVAADTLLLVSSGTAAGQELLIVKGDGSVDVGGPLYTGNNSLYPGGVFIGAGGWPYAIGAEWNSDTDNGALRLNAVGYQAGTSRFRDLIVYDGKSNPIAFFDGSSGYVGIGATPTARLDIGGTPGVDGIRFPDGTLMTSAGVGSASGLANTGDIVVNADSDADTAGAIHLQTGGADQVVVDNAGAVGIGVAAPGAKLHVRKTTGSNSEPGVILENYYTGTSGDYSLNIRALNDNTDDTGEVYITASNDTTGADAWMFGMDDDETFRIAYGAQGEIDDSITKLTVQQDGRVGINVVPPVGEALQVMAAGADDTIARFIGTTDPAWIAIDNANGVSGTPRIGSSADDMLFRTSGLEQARLRDDGNWQFGVPSDGIDRSLEFPEAAGRIFAQAGSYRLSTESDGGVRAAIDLDDSGTDVFDVTSGSARTPRLVVDNTGRVGVGEPNPQHLLHVGAGGDAGANSVVTALFTENGNTSVSIRDSQNDIESENWVGDLGGGLLGASIGPITNHDLQLITNDTPRMFIQNGGNIGVGISAPVNPFQIESGVDVMTKVGQPDNYPLYMHRPLSANGSGTGIAFAITTNVDDVGAAIVFNRTNTDSQGELRFYTKRDNIENSDPLQAMVISDAGNVGVGAPAPAAPLDVQSPTGTEGTLIAQFTDSTPTPMVQIYDSADGTAANAANAVMNVKRALSTGRSINAAGTINASGADYAEWIPWTGAKPEPGSIVKYKGTFVVVSSTRTAAFVGNDRFDAGRAILIGFAGQLPVKVKGPAHEGDYILPNGDGTGAAVRADQVTFEQYRKAVGIAWETNAGAGLNSVLTAVGMK